MALGILDDCRVAEVVLVPCLDAESPLCTHPPHRLTDVYCADVLQPGQADVQCTECAYTESRKEEQVHLCIIGRVPFFPSEHSEFLVAQFQQNVEAIISL